MCSEPTARRRSLSIAAFRGHAAVVAALIDARASVDLQSAQGGTALMLAASLGHSIVCKPLQSSSSPQPSSEPSCRQPASLPASPLSSFLRRKSRGGSADGDPVAASSPLAASSSPTAGAFLAGKTKRERNPTAA